MGKLKFLPLFVIKRIVLTVLLVFAAHQQSIGYPDDIIWASEVKSFSTQFSATEGSAIQILGKPSSTKVQGQIPTSWFTSRSKSYDTEYIEVAFPKVYAARYIYVYQSQNPGAITRIIAYHKDESLDTVYKSVVNFFYQQEGDILAVELDSTIKPIESIRIELDTKKVTGFNTIDAVALGISGEQPGYTINTSAIFSKYQGTNIGPIINSPYSELAPIISPDGNKLYFTRKYHPSNVGKDRLEDIWFSKKVDGRFSTPQQISELNNDYSNYAIALTQDENILLLGNVYNKDGTMSRGLSYSNKAGEKWDFPEELEIVDFKNIARESSFYISYDGLYLFSAINDGNSYGGVDLYISTKRDDGKWSKPENLGPSINTAANEGSPFLTADGRSLYFSSNGWPGYGSMDIFRAFKRKDFFDWTEPLNLGAGINSNNWDSYFTIPLDGVNGYYVSMKGGYGKEDIFRIELPEGLMKQEVVQLSGKVLDKKTGMPLSATIHYEDISTGEKLGVANTNKETGVYSAVLLPNHRYGFRAEADGYFPINQNLTIGNITDSLIQNGLKLDLELVEVEKGATITLNNIFFGFGESKLLPESYIELKRLAKLVKENLELNITVLGHTDNVGSGASNNVLSKERADAVAEYLFSIGVDRKQINTLGMGKKRPVADNSTEEGRAKNRRVEFVID